jgi:hypothetical protein
MTFRLSVIIKTLMLDVAMLNVVMLSITIKSIMLSVLAFMCTEQSLILTASYTFSKPTLITLPQAIELNIFNNFCK